MLVKGIKGEEIAEKARMDRRRGGFRKRADGAEVERWAGRVEGCGTSQTGVCDGCVMEGDVRERV